MISHFSFPPLLEATVYRSMDTTSLIVKFSKYWKFTQKQPHSSSKRQFSLISRPHTCQSISLHSPAKRRGAKINTKHEGRAPAEIIGNQKIRLTLTGMVKRKQSKHCSSQWDWRNVCAVRGALFKLNNSRIESHISDLIQTLMRYSYSRL